MAALLATRTDELLETAPVVVKVTARPAGSAAAPARNPPVRSKPSAGVATPPVSSRKAELDAMRRRASGRRPMDPRRPATSGLLTAMPPYALYGRHCCQVRPNVS